MEKLIHCIDKNNWYAKLRCQAKKYADLLLLG